MTGAEESQKEVSSLKNSILSTKTTSKIATWNVRTLFQCRNINQVIREMEKYDLKMLGISEMRWTGSRKLLKGGKTILYSGHSHMHTHGVGIVLSKEAQRALIGWQPVNHRIITTTFNNRLEKVTIIQAPTEASEDEEKDEFYRKLQDIINNTPSYDNKILMGDFNAQLGPLRQGCETLLSPYGTSMAHNNNGEWLISFCAVNGLTIGNIFFQHQFIHMENMEIPRWHDIK